MANLTSVLYRILSFSRDVNAVRRGPRAVERRIFRKALYQSLSRIFR